MSRRDDNPPGIKIRVAKDKMIQLVDRVTGTWIANVRWRPCGVVVVELKEDVRQEIVGDGDDTSQPKFVEANSSLSP